jgi:1-acyl-sn-glycerol-3-phosphate acyltransferase
MFNHLRLGIRASVFYFGYGLATIVIGVPIIVFGRFLPYRRCFDAINLWTRFAIFWVWFCCGVKFRLLGEENIPKLPFVLISKHQSPWETFFLHYFFAPVVTVLKVELTKVPIFGPALLSLHPIMIDRSQKKAALVQICEQGTQRLQEGLSIMIFPEGTRIQPGESSTLAKGAFVLAQTAKVPLLPIAHNAGEHWPSKKFCKYPGTIEVRIGQALDSSQPLNQLMQQTADWIMQQQYEICTLDREQQAKINVRL